MHDMEQIYKKYFKIVYKYLFCLTHNHDISEELAQETFYKAMKKIDTYKEQCKISVWLCQIAKNLWYNQYKRNEKITYTEELLDTQDLKILEEQIISNEETNIFIDEHLKSCNECKKVLENMKKEEEINDVEIEEREVKSIKKFMRQFKILRNILIIILCAYLLVVCRRFIIFTDISNKANKFDLDNYYSRIERMTNKGAIITQETYHKDSTYLIKSKSLAYASYGIDKIDITIYDNGKEHLELIHSGTEKVASTKNNQKLPETIYINEMSFTDILISSLVTSVHKVKIANKDCYLIKWDHSEIFIDVNTGMTIKLIQNTANSTSNYYYECGGVTDEEVKKPNTEGYVSYE